MNRLVVFCVPLLACTADDNVMDAPPAVNPEVAAAVDVDVQSITGPAQIQDLIDAQPPPAVDPEVVTPAPTPRIVEQTPDKDRVAELSPATAPDDECPSCTPAERDQLRIKEAERLAKSLNSLVIELEQLARYPEVSNLLLAEKDGGDLLRQLDRILGYMRQQQRPAATRQATAPAAANSSGKTATSPARQTFAGLRPVFAQAADAGRGIKANVILRSHRDDVILNVGEQFSHNSTRYTVHEVRLKAGNPEIVLRDSAGRKRVLPWQ